MMRKYNWRLCAPILALLAGAFVAMIKHLEGLPFLLTMVALILAYFLGWADKDYEFKHRGAKDE